MADPYLGEVKLMAFGFPPKGWAQCNGQILAIAQNQALFALLGTMYGGNGNVTFALPNLQGRVPMHFSNNFSQGQAAGEQAHTLLISEMPQHTHTAQAATANGNTPVPTNGFFAAALNVYRPGNPNTAINPLTVASAGGSQPHDNMQPYLTLNFCIALQGIFPSRN